MNIVAAALMPHPPLMISEIGNGQELEIIDTINHIREMSSHIKLLAPETIVIISPHGPIFTDAITIRSGNRLDGDFEAFGHSEIEISIDTDIEFVEMLLQKSKLNNVPVAAFNHELAKRFDLDEGLDHGIMVPLSMLNDTYSEYQVVAIHYGLISEVSLYRFGMLIQAVANELGRRTVVIASGDLSHVLMEGETQAEPANGMSFDYKMIHCLENQKVQEILCMDQQWCNSAKECGKRSIDIMLGTFEGYKANQVTVSYEGPFGVGYGAAFFANFETSGSSVHFDAIEATYKANKAQQRINESTYVKLARKAIEMYVQSGQTLRLTSEESKVFPHGQSRGVFVSIKDQGGLRGCIGTTSGTCVNLGEEIVSNAIKACSEDPRFEEVQADELEDLIISVDVLSIPEAIDSEALLDPKTYGIIVKCDFRHGLLLPNLEGINTVEEQLRIARNKGGIEEHEQIELYRFTVERYT